MKRRLSRNLMVGLDAARAFAAVYVVLHHVAASRGWSHGAGLLFRFGQEAVLIFFLLSGFVIFANERDRALAIRGYYLRRLRRIYPALLVAMAVSTLVALDNGDLRARFSWGALVGTLANLQDIALLKSGVIVNPYLGNDPLWSLSYEAAFYLVFPFVLRLWFARPALTQHLVGLVCCAAYLSYALVPNHFSLVTAYFLVWWVGAMAAQAYLSGGRTVQAIGVSLWWLVALCVVAAAVVAVVGYRGFGYYPSLPLRHFATGLVMLLLFYGPIGAWCAAVLRRGERAAVGIASISYGLYVLHFPLLVDWRRTQGTTGLAFGVAILIVAAWLVDRELSKALPAIRDRTPRPEA